jgi:serine protease Do
MRRFGDKHIRARNLTSIFAAKQILATMGMIFLSLPGLAAESLAPAVAKVASGVVNIRTSDAATTQRTQTKDNDAFFSLFMGATNQPQNPQNASRSIGSGFFFRDTATIVTNFHVIKDATNIVIFATELNVFRQASIIGRDPKMDLAVLRVKPVDGAKPLQFGSSETMRPGDTVFAIGNPFGYGNTVSSGILSAKGRTVGSGALSYLLQTDVPLNPGNSGGPLFDLKSNVIGINTANVTEAQGISFAIPGEVASRRIRDILESGSPSQIWLGLIGENIYDDPRFSAESYGVLVRNILKDSPAEAAGIRKGDVIRKFNGLSVSHIGKIEHFLLNTNETGSIKLEIYRAGKKLTFEIKPEPRPQRYAGTQEPNLF